ncbi:MAG: hypothetical protein J6I73_02520 [Treponema sp.]|nr:hypothetical protein [Treponema sp.]
MKKLIAILAVVCCGFMLVGCNNNNDDDDTSSLCTDGWYEKELTYEGNTLTCYFYYSSNGSYSGIELKDGLTIGKGLNVVLTTSSSSAVVGTLTNAKFAFKTFAENDKIDDSGKNIVVSPTTWQAAVIASMLLENKKQRITQSSTPICVRKTDNTYSKITDIEDTSWKKIIAMILIESLLKD